MAKDIDSEIEALVGKAPETAEVAPLKAEAGFGGFEGADRYSRSLATWQPAIRSADTEVLSDKYMADARVRDLLRNDSFMHAGGDLHKDTIVGHRFSLQSKPNYKLLGLDESWADEFQEEIEGQWEAVAESEDCWLDAAGTMTFTGMVRLAVLTALSQGEIVASAEWLRAMRRPCSTAINLIDPERLANPMTSIESPRMRGGVEKNRFGAPIAYHIWDQYPYDALVYGSVNDVRRVPARKPWGRRQIIHIVDQQRPNQTRGISQLVTALKETRVGRKFRDLTLQNAVLQATYAATIESELPTEVVMQQLQGDTTSLAEYMGEYGAGFLSKIQEYAEAGKSLQIDGVRIPHLFPGTKLDIKNMATPGGVGENFEMSLLRYLAAAMGCSYEELSHDFSNTNLSAIRAGMNTTRRTMTSRKAMIADRFANQVFQLWFEEQVNNFRFETMNARSAPNIYEGLNMNYYTRARWIGSSWGQIDELKETQAAILRVKMGLSTYEIEAAKLGMDWRELLKQAATERAYMDKLGLDFYQQEDNTINAASGTNNGAKQADENTGEGGEQNG